MISLKKHKLEIKITIILLSISIIAIILIVGTDFRNDQLERNTSFLVFDIEHIWKRTNDSFVDVNDDEEKRKLFNSRKFQIFTDNVYIDTAQLYYNTNFYYYKNSELQRIKQIMIAYSGNEEISIVNPKFLSLEDSDYVIITDVLAENNIVITRDTELTLEQKVVFDFDQDGEDESFYIISNLYSEDIFNMVEMSFQVIIYVDSDNIKVLKNEVLDKSREYLDTTSHNIISFIRFKNSESYDILLNKYIPMGGLNTCPTLLSLRNNQEWKEIITCQEVES